MAFLLFRLFDILKPWPVNLAERHLKGGMAIMADDVSAAGKPPAATSDVTLHERHIFSGDRNAVRLATVGAALALALRLAEEGKR